MFYFNPGNLNISMESPHKYMDLLWLLLSLPIWSLRLSGGSVAKSSQNRRRLLWYTLRSDFFPLLEIAHAHTHTYTGLWGVRCRQGPVAGVSVLATSHATAAVSPQTLHSCWAEPLHSHHLCWSEGTVGSEESWPLSKSRRCSIKPLKHVLLITYNTYQHVC